MGKKHKLIIIILFLAILIETVLIILLSTQKASETREKLNVKLQLNEVSEKLSTKESQAKDLEKKLLDMEKTNSDLKAQVDEFSAQQKIIEAKMEAAKEVASAIAKQLQRQHEDTFRQLKNFSSESRKIQLTLISKIESLLETKYDLEKQLVKLKEEYANQIDNQAAQGSEETLEIPLGKINIQRQPPEAAGGISGIILSVDNTYNFAIVDLGRESGIKANDRLTVFRHEKKIGELEVREIYKHMSLADIISEKTVAALRKNDKVIPALSE